MGRKSSRAFTGAQGSLAARARARLDGTAPAGDPIEKTLEEREEAGEEHLVTVLAQRRTVHALATISRIMRDTGQKGATRLRAAQILLEWGWPKPGAVLRTQDRRPLGSERLEIVVKSAVNPGAAEVVVGVRASQEQSHATDPAPQLPAPPELADL